MDECGDAEGNYTVLSLDSSKPPGLYPLAVLHKHAPVSVYIALYYSQLLSASFHSLPVCEKQAIMRLYFQTFEDWRTKT